VPRAREAPSGHISPLGDASDPPITVKPGQVTLEYIAHACFRIHTPAGKCILIDPYASRIWLGYEFPKELAADSVLISHAHYDHDGGTSSGRPAPWTDEVMLLRFPGKYTTGDVQITGIAGEHGFPSNGRRMGNTLWLLEVSGLRIVHFGDNGPLSKENVQKLGRVDILMMPIDAQNHILTEPQVEDIRHSLRPRILIPMHYRIPELEQAGSPQGLGPIDPWLSMQANVTRLNRHTETFTAETLPQTEQILVFKYSPRVPPPSP
jgi:L-ascorbate metabolism protein UlaG (beta-lactamase superfamily)